MSGGVPERLNGTASKAVRVARPSRVRILPPPPMLKFTFNIVESKLKERRDMNRKAFTIIELLIVVLVIGILAGIGMPQLADSMEKAKGGDAKLGLNQIYRAELEYGANRMGLYTDSIDDLSEVTLTNRYWAFSINATPSNVFTAIATRSSGSRSGQTITLDNLGNLSGNWEFLD